jgi:hypothetical protein
VRPARAALVAVALATLASSAGAFGTISSLGQNAEHGRITRLALGCRSAASDVCLQPQSLAAMIGKDGDRGAVSVPDLSRMTFQASAHCDNGDWLATPGYAHTQAEARAALEACQAWMSTSLDGAVAAAGGLVGADGKLLPSALSADCRLKASDGAKCQVVGKLGLLLHASQDFYSHTNWADRADPSRPIGPENPPGLGHSEPSPYIALRGESAFPDGLMSGCFTAVPERAFCNAGSGGRVKHAFLNKDEGTIEPVLGAGKTERGKVEGNFARAITAAIADTRDKWALFEERLSARYGAERGARMACAISHDAPMRDCGG